MNEKSTLKQLLETSEGKKLLFLGKEGIFSEKEIARFLKPHKIAVTKYLEEDVVAVVEHPRLNPVEEDISNDAYAQKIPLYKLGEFEQLLSDEIDDDALLMAIKLGNDQERVVRLLSNEHLSDTLFVRLLKLYRFNEEDEDNRQDRDVIMYTLRRYIEINPNEEDLLYSYLTLRRLATEATDPHLLEALMGFPNFSFLVRGKEKVTLKETIARNRAISHESVRKLLGLRHQGVNVSLAGNPAVDVAVLGEMLKRNDPQIDRALASNPNIDDAIFQTLLKREGTVEVLLVHQPMTNERLAWVEAAGLPDDLFALLGANEMLGNEMIEQLLQRSEPVLLKLLATNPKLSSVQLQTIYEKASQDYAEALASNPATPTKILEAIYEANQDNMQWLAALASNPSLPQAILQALFEKDELAINKGLATNAALSDEMLDILKLDTRLQTELAQNERLAASFEQVLKQNKVMLNV